MQNICKAGYRLSEYDFTKAWKSFEKQSDLHKNNRKTAKNYLKTDTISESFIEKKYMKNYNRGQIREKDVKGNEKELHENFSALRSSSTGSVDPGKCAELF